MKLLTSFSFAILGMSLTGLLKFLDPELWTALVHALANIVTAIVALVALYKQYIAKNK